MGSVGDNWDDDIYLWPSACHLNDVLKPDTIDINPNDPNCTRVTSLIDPLIKDGAVTTDSVFSSAFATAFNDKILMMVGPSWYGQYLFPGIVTKGDLAMAQAVELGAVARPTPVKFVMIWYHVLARNGGDEGSHGVGTDVAFDVLRQPGHVTRVPGVRR